MEYTVSLPAFTGPLDLLLRLIERAELDVTTIALAQVTDQYLVYVRGLDEPDPGQLAAFVSMAARLLLIKSRALLPRPAPTSRTAAGEDDGEALARQLREYQRYKRAAALLRRWQEEGRRSFVRLAPPPLFQPPAVPLRHTVADMVHALERRMQLRLAPGVPALPLALAPRLTVATVSERVRERLVRGTWFSFEDLLSARVTRQELTVSFWAMLELLKRRAIAVEQTGLFGPILIGPVGKEEP